LKGAVLDGVDLGEANTAGIEIDEPKEALTDDLKDTLKRHKEWLDSNGGTGQCGDFQGADFSNMDFTGHDLSAANLTGANFAGARLSRCTMKMAIASGADFSGAELMLSDLRGIDLTNANLQGAILRRANMAGLELKDKKGRDTGKVWKSKLAGTDFSNADLTFARMGGADIEGVVFANAKLKRTDLRGCKLPLAKTEGALLADALVGDAAEDEQTPLAATG